MVQINNSFQTFFHRGKTYWIDILRNPPLKACAIMALGLCFTFVGYEYARAASITLLAAEEIGFGTEALPLTVAVGSPLSGLVLYLYTKSIKKYGSKLTLRFSHIACIFLFLLMLLNTCYLKGLVGKVIVVFFYALREIYISLLSSQQWAFISSTLDKSTSSYLVTFSGIVSIASAIGGCTVEQLVSFGGMRGLLLTVVIMTTIGLVLAEIAFKTIQEWKDATTEAATAMINASAAGTGASIGISTNEGATASIQSLAYHPEKHASSYTKQQHHLTKRSKEDYKGEMTGEEEMKPQEKKERKSSLRRRSHHHQTSNTTDASTSHTNTQQQQGHTQNTSSRHLDHTHSSGSSNKPKAKLGFWLDSWNLIQSNYILKILFFEAVAHQICTNMLNIMFHNGLRSYMLDDTWKAKLVGRFFATVNITSSSLQCFVLPILLSQQSLPTILNYLPVIVLIPLTFGLFQPGLIAVMLSFGTMKVLEYSIMHSASELIYMPLGQEVRYVGKELIKFFGHKLGKSFASLILSVLIAKLTPSLWLQILWGAVFTMLWGIVLMKLSTMLEDIQAEHDRTQTMTSTHSKNAHIPRESTTGHESKNPSAVISVASSASHLGYIADAGSTTGTSNLSSGSSPVVYYEKNSSSSSERKDGPCTTPNTSSASLHYEHDDSSPTMKSLTMHAPISTANLLLSSKRAAANNTPTHHNPRRKPSISSSNTTSTPNGYTPIQRPYQHVRLHTSTSMPLFAHFAGDQRKRGMKYVAGIASPRYPVTPTGSAKDPRDNSFYYQGSSASITSLASSVTSGGGGLSHTTSQSSLFDGSMDDLRSMDLDTASTTTMTTAASTTTAALMNGRDEDEYAITYEGEEHTTTTTTTTTNPPIARDVRAVSSASTEELLLFTGSFDDEKALVVMQSPNTGVVVTTSSAMKQKKKEQKQQRKEDKQKKKQNKKNKKNISNDEDEAEGSSSSENENSSHSGIFIDDLPTLEKREKEGEKVGEGAQEQVLQQEQGGVGCEGDEDSLFDGGIMIDEEDEEENEKELLSPMMTTAITTTTTTTESVDTTTTA